MTQPRVPMVGKTFGRLTVVEQAPAPAGKTGREAWYRCRCQCGGEITTRGTSLRRGITRSCGCLRREETQRRNQAQAARDHDLAGRASAAWWWRGPSPSAGAGSGCGSAGATAAGSTRPPPGAWAPAG